MINIPLAQAKNQLSDLIGRVERGETVTLTTRSKAVAQLMVYAPDSLGRQCAQVQHAFERLSHLRSGVALDGRLKAMAREGLA